MSNSTVELYHREADTLEENNSAHDHPITTGYYQFLLHYALAEQMQHLDPALMPEHQQTISIQDLEPETIENLKELGYLPSTDDTNPPAVL